MTEAKLGYDNNHKLYTTPVLNVFHHPRFSTFWYGFRYALMTSSFFSLGTSPFIWEIFELKENLDDDYAFRPQVYNIMAMLQGSVFIIALSMYMARYPYAPQSVQAVGRYTGNVSNALGNVFLYYYAIHIIEISMAAGFPIATGIIEDACRYLINDRLDITGARWGLQCAEAILKLRSINSSGNYEKYWTFYQQQSKQRLYNGCIESSYISPIVPLP